MLAVKRLADVALQVDFGNVYYIHLRNMIKTSHSGFVIHRRHPQKPKTVGTGGPKIGHVYMSVKDILKQKAI